MKANELTSDERELKYQILSILHLTEEEFDLLPAEKIYEMLCEQADKLRLN
jgi:hypothetical protein